VVSWSCALGGAELPSASFDLAALGGWEARGNSERAPWDWRPSWGRVVPEHWPRPEYHYEFANFGLSVEATLTYYAGCKSGWGQGIGVLAAGWPMRAMKWELVQDDPTPAVAAGAWPRGFVAESIWRGGMALPDSALAYYQGGWVRIPVQPVPAGFAANTFFGAGVLWVLLHGPRRVRGIVRRRRGLCPVCAYPAGVSPVCTECGAAVEPVMAESGVHRGAGVSGVAG
jgi:hypothetical protein